MGINLHKIAPIFAIILFFILLFLYSWIQHKRLLKRMQLRGRLTDEEMRAEFSDNQVKAELAVELRQMLAQQSSLPAELFGPDHDNGFLIVDSVDSLGRVEFVIAVEKRYNIQIADSDAEHLNTLRQFVDHVAHLITPP